MKLSDIFPLPLDTSAPAGEVLRFEAIGRQAVATVHAVNHHDALVEALQGVVDYLDVVDGTNPTILAELEHVLDEVRKDGR